MQVVEADGSDLGTDFAKKNKQESPGQGRVQEFFQ